MSKFQPPGPKLWQLFGNKGMKSKKSPHFNLCTIPFNLVARDRHGIFMVDPVHSIMSYGAALQRQSSICAKKGWGIDIQDNHK